MRSALFVGLLFCSAAFSAVYTAENDFSIVNGNSNGVWSYGYRVGSNPAFTLFSTPEANFAGSPGFNRWTVNPVGGGDPLYYLGIYQNGSGPLLLHPSNGAERSVLRFTAPHAGIWNLDAIFSDGDTATTTIEIQRTGDLGFLFSDTITDNDTDVFQGLVSLAANQSVDFIVGNNGNHNNDSTLLQLTISEVPEPGTMALIGAGLLGVASFGRRRLARR